MSSELVVALNRLAAALEQNNKLQLGKQLPPVEFNFVKKESEPLPKFGTNVHDSKTAKYLTTDDSGTLWEITKTTEFYADLVGKSLRYLTQLGKNSVFQDIENLSATGNPMVYYLAADKTFVAKPTVKVSNCTSETIISPNQDVYGRDLNEADIGSKFTVIKGGDSLDDEDAGKIITITSLNPGSVGLRFNAIRDDEDVPFHENTLLRRVI